MTESVGPAWVRTVVAPNPGPYTLDGTRTYVVGGDPCLIIDPGPALADHLDAVEVAVGSADVAAICITHFHADHAAGAAELALRLGSPLAAAPESAEKAGLDAPQIELAEGTAVRFGGGQVEALAAPGHCPDHVCFLWRAARALFSGDVILGEGTSMIAPPEGDIAAYLSTLQRFAGLDLEIIYPGHGAPIEEPQQKLAEYIAHRLERERQVLEALKAGATTPAEIRARVYLDLDPRLLEAAEGSVRAHLNKLVAETRVSAMGDRFTLVE